MWIRWTGWGILAFFVWLASLMFGIGGAVVLFTDDTSKHRLAIGVAGAIVGSLVGALVVRLLGIALNRRRGPGGSWVWTDRHTIYDVSVEDFWWYLLLGAVLALPCLTAGFIPKGVTQGLVIGWIILMIVVLVLFFARRERREMRERQERQERRERER
jgi:hypothetical protein